MTESRPLDPAERDHRDNHFDASGNFTPVKGCRLCDDAVDGAWDMASDLGD